MTDDEMATWLAEITGGPIQSVAVGDVTHHFLMKEDA